MPKFAANLSMMFTEVPFLERFHAARAAGFKGVEYLFPYAESASEIATRLNSEGLSQALFNLPPGDWEGGEKGLAALPGRSAEFRDSVSLALEYAEIINCPTLHIMAGIVDPKDREAAHDQYLENLRYASECLAKANRIGVIEPINTRDMPGYFLNTTSQGKAILGELNSASLGLQFDMYHCQIMEGDLAMRMADLQPLISHIQIAGVPDRHEPDLGEVNYPFLFDEIDRLGLDCWVGCEYRPKGETQAGLGWLKPWL